MEAEVGSPELILSTKREEHGALIGEKLGNTVKEMIPGEVKNVEAGQNQPPETVRNIVRSEEMRKATDSEAETEKIVNGDKVEASRGECFLESPPVDTATSEVTCKASADHQADETTILAEENMVETENHLQKVAKTVAAVEGGKVETDNVDRDQQNSETVINNLDIKNVAEENKYVEKFGLMASEETRSQEIIHAEVDIHGELSKNDELLDLHRLLEKSETQRDKFEGYMDVISENAAAPTGKHCVESGHEEDMKEDPTTDDTYAEKGSNFPEYTVDLQEEIEAGKVVNPENSSELCPLHKEAAAEVQREKQKEVCEANGSTTAEEKPNEETYEVQTGVESSLNHVPEYGPPRDEVDKKANETEFEMLEKVKMETEDRMVVKDPAENLDEAKTEEALNTGLEEITTEGHDSKDRFLEGSHAGEAELNCKDSSCKSENLIELETVLNEEICDKPNVMEAEEEKKEHVKEVDYVEDVAPGSTKIEKVKSTENEVEACNFKEESFEEPEAAGMDKLTTIETIQDDGTLESTAVDTSLKHEDSLPPEVETLAPAEASKEDIDQNPEQDIQHDEEEKEVLQEHQPGDKIERSIDVAYKDERTAPTEDVGEKISITEEGDDVADRSNVNKENGSLDEDSKLTTEASVESNVTETINIESTSKTDETEVEKVEGEYKFHEEICKSNNVEDNTEAETAGESSEANLLAETRCDDTERTDDEAPSNRRELDIVDEITKHRPQENKAIKETEISEDFTYKIASGEGNAVEQTVNVADTDLSPQSIKEETIGIFHDNKNNAKELNVQVDDKLEPPSISEHVEEHILEEPDIEEIFTVQTERKTVKEIYREHETVAEANMPQQEVHAIPQTSEQEEEVEKHIEEKPTTLKENVTSVEEQTIPDNPEKEDGKPEIHERDETEQNITEENAITNIPSQSVGEETTKESLIEDEADKEVLHQEVKDLSVESIEQNLEPSETKSNTSKDTAEPNAAREETSLNRIDENLVDKTLVSEVPREEKGEIFEPEPTVTDSNSASFDIMIEETSMKDCGKMMVDPVELEAEAEDLARIAASGVKVDNEHADEQTENVSVGKETVIPTAAEHGIDEPVEKIEQADEADQRDLVTGTKPLDGNVEGDTKEASAPEAKEHKLGTIEASEAIDGTPAKDETPLAHEEVKVEIKEREMLETEKTSELQGTSKNSDAEISKNQEALDIEIAENAESNTSLIEGSKGIEELGTSTNNKEADLKQEEPACNFEESTKEGVESNKAELDHNHVSEVCSTINEGSCLAEDLESVNPGEKCQNACEPVSEKQWDNKQPETSETKLKEEKEQDAITEETMAQSTQECITQKHEEVEPKFEAEDHNHQRDDSIEITKTSKIREEGVEEADESEIIKEITEDKCNDKELEVISLGNETIKEGNNFEREEDSNMKAEESQLIQISDEQIAKKDDDSIVVDALSSDAAELEKTGNAHTEEAKICAERLETAPANEVLKELSSQEKDLEDEPTDNSSDAKGLYSIITTETDLHNEESKTMKPEEISYSVAVHSTTECENTVQKEELRELEVPKLGFKPTEEEKGTPEELSKEEGRPPEISSKPETEESASQTVNADSLSEEPDTKPTRPTEYSLQETSKSEDILEVVKKCEEASDPHFQKNEEVIASEPSIQHEETLGTSEETEIKEEHFQAATQPAAEKHWPKKHEEASSFELEKTESASRSMLVGQNDEALSSLEEAGDKEEYLAASDLIDEEHLKEERREESEEGFSPELQKTAVPEVEDKDSPARPEEDETQAKSFDTAKPDSIIEENLQAEIQEKDEETSTPEFETTARDFESTAEVQSHEALSKSEITSKQEQPDADVMELSVEENPLQEHDKKPKEETTLQSTKTEIDAAEVQSLEAVSNSETTSKEEQQDAAVTELPVEENPPQEQDEKPEETTLQSTETEIEAAEFQSHEALSKSETTSKEEQLAAGVTELPVEENPPQGQGDNPKEETTLQSEKEIDAAEIQSHEALSKSETTSKEEQVDAGVTELLVEENSLQEQDEKPKEETTLPLEKTEVEAAETQSHEVLSESETTSKEEQLDAGVTELAIEENPPQEQDDKPKEETTWQLTKTEIDAAEVQRHEALTKSETTSKEEQLDAGVMELPVEENPPQGQGDNPKEETTLQSEKEIDAAEIQSLEALSKSETKSKEEQLDAGVTELLVEENSLQEQDKKPKEETTLPPVKTEVEPAEAQSHEALSESETTSKEEQLDAGVIELAIEENPPQEQDDKPKEETTWQSTKTEIDAAEVQRHEALPMSETTSKEEQLDADVMELPVEENPPQGQGDNPKEETTLQSEKEIDAAEIQSLEALSKTETTSKEEQLDAGVTELLVEENSLQKQGEKPEEETTLPPEKTKVDAAEAQSHEALSESETTSKEEQLDAGVTELAIEENPPQEQDDKPKEETTWQSTKTEIDAAEVQRHEALSKSETTSKEEQLDAGVMELPVEENPPQGQGDNPKEETTLQSEKEIDAAEIQSLEALSKSETTSKEEQLDAGVTELLVEENSLQEQGEKPEEETTLPPEKTKVDAAEAQSHEALSESETTSKEEQLDAGVTELAIEENTPQEQDDKPKEETTWQSTKTEIDAAEVQRHEALSKSETTSKEEQLDAGVMELPVEENPPQGQGDNPKEETTLQSEKEIDAAEIQSLEALSKSETTSKEEQLDAGVTELLVEENSLQEQGEKPKEETTLPPEKTKVDAAEAQSHEALSESETTSKEEQLDTGVTELVIEENPPQEQDDKPKEETTWQSTKTEIDAAEVQRHEALSKSETTSKEEQLDAGVMELPVEENPPQGQGDDPKEETTLQSEKEIDAAEIQSLEALSKSETASKEEELDAGVMELPVEENPPQGQGDDPKEETTLQSEKEIDAAEIQSLEALSKSEITSKQEQTDADVMELSVEENPLQEHDKKPKEETTLQSTKTEIDAAEVQRHEALSKSETTSKEEQLDADVTELPVEENPPQEQGDKAKEETTLQMENTEIDAAGIQSLKALSKSESTSKEEQLDAGVTELLAEENSIQEQGKKPKEETILQPEKTEVDAAEAQSHEAVSESESTSKEEQLDAGVTELLVEENSVQEQGEKPKEETTLQPEKTDVEAAEAQSHEALSESETTSKEEQEDAGVTKLPIEEKPLPEQDDKPKEEITLQSTKTEIDAAEVQGHEALSKSETTSKGEQLDAGVTELPIEENPLQEQGDKPKEEPTFQLEKTEIDAANVQSLEALSKSETTSKEEQLDAAVTELPVEKNSLQEQDEKPKEETTLPLEKTEIDAAEAQSQEALSQSETTSKEEQEDATVTELPDEENSLQEQGQKPKEETTLLPEKTKIDAAEAWSHEALTKSETTSNEEQPVEQNPPREQGKKPKEETTLQSEETKIAFEPEAPVQKNAVPTETEENETEAEILRAAEIQLPVEKKLLELVEKVENDSAEIKKEEAPAAETHSFEATTVAEQIHSKPITELRVEDTFHEQHSGNSKDATSDELEKTRKSFELIPEVRSPEEHTKSESRGKKEQLNAATTQLPVEGNLPEEQGEKIEKESSMKLGKAEQGLESETQFQKNEILEKTEENETKTETLTAAATELPVEKKILELVENIKEESGIKTKKEEATESAAKADSYEAFSLEAETLTNEEILSAPIAKQTVDGTLYKQEGGNSIESSNEELDKTERSFESMQSMPEVASPQEHTESKTGGKKGQLNAATTQLPVEENEPDEQSKKLEEEPRTELEGTKQAFESEAQVQKNKKLGEIEENETKAEIPGAEEIELPVERKILELVEKETDLPVSHSCETPKVAESETNEETLTARTAEPTIKQNIHKSKETSNAEPEKAENAFESVPEVGSLEEVSESETGGKVDKLTAATTQLQIKEYLPEEEGENLEEKSRMDLEEKTEQALETRIEVQKNENEILLETEENETQVEILGAAETELPVGKKLLELVEKVEEETSTHSKKETAAEYASEVKSPEAPTTADEIKEVHGPEEITTIKELLNAPNAEQTIEENFPDGQGMKLDEAATNDLELEKTEKALESLPEVRSDKIPTELEETEIKDEHLKVAAAELKAEENQCEKKIIVTQEIKREISSEEGMSETAASQNNHLVSPGEEIKEILHEDGSNAKSYIGGKLSETFIIAKGTQNEEVGDEEANNTDHNPQAKVTESEDMQSTGPGNKEDKIDSVVPEKQLDQNIETHEESYDSSSPDTDSAGNLMDDEKFKYQKDATAESINQEYQEARYANPTTSFFVEPAQVQTGKEGHIKAAAAEMKIKEDEKAFEVVHEVQSNEASNKSEESETKLKILEDVTPESSNKENLLDEVAEKHEEDSNAVFESTEASESILVVEPHEGVTESEETKTRKEHLRGAPAKLAIENLTEKQGQKHEEASPLELEKNEKASDSVFPDQKNELVSKSEGGEAKKVLVGATSESAVQENFPDVDQKQDETSNLEPEKTEKAPEPFPEEDVQELIVAKESQQESLDQDVAESCQEDELLREDEANKTLEATTGLTAESVHHETTFTTNEDVKHEILNEKVEHERVGDKDSQQAIMIDDIKESLQADESLREDVTKEDEPLGEDESTEKNHETVTTDLAAQENLYEKTLTANVEVKNEISTELAVDNMAEKQCQTHEEASYLELETSEKVVDPVPADQKTETITRSEGDGTKKELVEAASEFSIQENFLDKDGKQDEAPNLELEKTEKAPESGPEIQSHEPFCKSEEAENGKEHLETETSELTGEKLPGEQNEMSKEDSKTELEITAGSLDLVPESHISDVLTKSEDYGANEKNLDTAATDITAAKNEFERKFVGKKEQKNEISTEEELVVAEESQQAFLDEIAKENCQEDGSLRQNEAKATITTKVSVGKEIKDSYQEAVEKNLEAVTIDLTAEENQCDKTTTATEEPKNKISNEEVLQEKADVEDSYQVSTWEEIKDSPQKDEPTPANYPGDKINTASIITETETQVEQLAQYCEDSASQEAQRPGSNETLDIVSNRNDTAEESILPEAGLEMKLNEMATEVDVEGQNSKPISAETDSGPSIPSEEIKAPELVVMKHEWEPKESTDNEEIKKSKIEEEVNKMLSSPPTTCVISEEPLPVKEGGKGEDASESLVSERPPGESHKDADRIEQFEANSAQNNSNVQSDQKEQMLYTRELESSWLTETIQKGGPIIGDEISKTEKGHLVLEEHINAKVVPSEEEERIKNGEEPDKSKVQAEAFTKPTERKPDEDEIYSTLQDKKEEFGLLPHTQVSCAETSQKEDAVNLGEAYEVINNIQPPTKPSKAIPEEKISISIASDKNLDTMVTTGNRDFPLVQKETIAETARAYPPELQQGTCDEIKTGDENEETAKASIQEPSAHTSLFDLMERSIREHPHETGELTKEKGQIVHEEEMYRKEEEKIHVEEPLTDEERECEEDEEEHKKADSGSDAPVMVEAHKDMDEKTTHKKHHNILSGVGSKVKHSIAKVKKAITGKSSHHKQHSPK